jgi:hypothetical protein
MSRTNEEAAFYRAALLLGLIRGEEVIRWADEVIASDESAPPAFADIATTPPDDLTALRRRLFDAGGGVESQAVVRKVIGLIHRDLSSGRRGLQDTMTVLKQLRAFVAVDRALNEHLKTLGVDMFVAAPGSQARTAAEQRVRDWLKQHE